MDDEFYLEHELKVRKEADLILYDKGILKLIEDYGEVRITGSYFLKLMAKKDLDFSLINPDLTNTKFFELASIIADKLNVPSIYYRNSKIAPIPNRPPESMYFGFNFNGWWIDLWNVPEWYADESVKYLNDILDWMTPSKRINIIKLKMKLLENGTYGKIISSKELYSVFREHDCSGLDEFNFYLKSMCGKDIYSE